MGWLVFVVWLVWDLAAKACGRTPPSPVPAMPSTPFARLESRGAMRNQRCYRCSICSSCWPFTPAFSKCAQCGSKCWGKQLESDDDVPTLEEALRLKHYSEFETFCELRDDKQAQEDIDRLASDLPLYPDAFAG